MFETQNVNVYFSIRLVLTWKADLESGKKSQLQTEHCPIAKKKIDLKLLKVKKVPSRVNLRRQNEKSMWKDLDIEVILAMCIVYLLDVLG